MKEGEGRQENMAAGDALNKQDPSGTAQVQTASGHLEDLRLAWDFTVPDIWR